MLDWIFQLTMEARTRRVTVHCDRGGLGAGAAIIVIRRKTSATGKNTASSHQDGLPNRIKPGPKMHARMAPTVGAQHGAVGDLAGVRPQPLTLRGA